MRLHLAVPTGPRPRGGTAALVAVCALALVPLAASPAQALAAPSRLSPSGVVGDNTPVFSWSAVGTAAYDVQVDNNADFSSPLASVSTQNTYFVPGTLLPPGTVHWRVRARSSTGASGWRTSQISIRPKGAPTTLSPAEGEPLSQPNKPALLSWTPVPQAVSYTVEVDTDTDFIGARALTAPLPRIVFPDAQSTGTYFWRVQGTRANGEVTPWSAAASYQIQPLADVSGLSPDNEDVAIEDVVLTWNPVEGASRYQLRYSTDRNFNVSTSVTVVGTQWSPKTTLTNDQYFWQVRAVDQTGNPMPWTATPATFRRSWPQQPQQLYPPDRLSPVVSAPVFLEWTPVRHASRYQVDVGSDPNFSPGTYRTCYTSLTTYTPGRSGDCLLNPGTPHYWRVRGLDDPGNVVGIYSATRSFIYDNDVRALTPAMNATVTIPTLSWEPVTSAAKYDIDVYDASGQQVTGITTLHTEWTPHEKLAPAKGPFWWTIKATDVYGKPGPLYYGGSFRTQEPPTSVAGTPLQATGGHGTSTVRMPTLSWVPMPGAASYRLSIGPYGSNYLYDGTTAPVTTKRLEYPAATDVSKQFLQTGRYQWRVQAYDSTGAGIGTSGWYDFSITDLPDVTGQRLALGGSTLLAGGCTRRLTDPLPNVCEAVPATPVLAWDDVPDAAYYMVYLSRDGSLTNQEITPVKVNHPMWALAGKDGREAIADSQAGKAYSWYVRPCKADNVCNPDPISRNDSATHAFSKTSPAVPTFGPTDQQVLANEAHFSWEDYLTTNQGEAGLYEETGEHSSQAAEDYLIQVAKDPSFATGTVVDSQAVDQTSYAALLSLYPEGRLYWRVQARDAQGNGLATSPVRSFLKLSPSADLRGPAEGATVAGDVTFTWSAKPFNTGYRIEVYKDGDANLSPSNRVLSELVKTTAYAPRFELPPSELPYLWRVQRIDASNNPGQWSEVRSFRSSGTLPTLLAPAPGGYLNPRAFHFSWDAAPKAVRYRVEMRKPGTTSTVTWTTAATALAPTVPPADGYWAWAVTGLDSNNRSLGTTPWRGFRVDTVRPTVAKKSWGARVRRTSDLVATFSEPVSGVTAASFSVTRSGTTKKVPARITISGDRRTVRLNPSASLAANRYYKVSMTFAIKDRAGNALWKRAWSFKAVP